LLIIILLLFKSEAPPPQVNSLAASKDEFDKFEEERLKDLKERDEFVNRLKEKEAVHFFYIIKKFFFYFLIIKESCNYFKDYFF
jgi:hypothetical protein